MLIILYFHRLRGDWSDTGPNARPESEGASTENTLMQRMSDLFVRWIEESFRGSVRRRRQTQSRDSSSTSTSSSTSFPSRSTNSSSSDSSGILDASVSSPSRDRDAGTEEQSDDMEESESNSPSVISVRERSQEDVNDFRESLVDTFRESPIASPGESPSGSSKISLVFPINSSSEQSSNTNKPCPERSSNANNFGFDRSYNPTLESSRGSLIDPPGKSAFKSDPSSDLYGKSLLPDEDVKMRFSEDAGRDCKELKNEKISENSCKKDESVDFGSKHGNNEQQQNKDRCQPSISVCRSDATSSNLNNQSGTSDTRQTEPLNQSQQGLPSAQSNKSRISNSEVKNEQLNSKSQIDESERRVRSKENINRGKNQSDTSGSLSNTYLLSNNQSSGNKPGSAGHQEGVALPRGETSQRRVASDLEIHDNSEEISNNEITIDGQASAEHDQKCMVPPVKISNSEILIDGEASAEHDQKSVAPPRGDSSECITQETGTDSGNSHNEAATRIQRMFRNYKAAKSSRSISDCDYTIDDVDGVRWVPKMTRVYRGHRNARTMVSKAYEF